MKLSPKQLRITVAVLGLLALIGRQFLPGGTGFDINAILASAELADLLTYGGFGAVVSQLFKRADDKSPAQVAAEIAKLSVQPVFNVTMPTVQSPTAEDGLRIREALKQASKVYGDKE